MMSLPLIVSLSITLISALPAAVLVDEDYPLTVDPRNLQENYIVPQKRAALVLDRLLVALQKALRETPTSRFDPDRDGPRTAPLRLAHYDANDMKDQEEGSKDWSSAPRPRQQPRSSPQMLF